MLKEFRDFAMRGNVLDLAVGVIIGAAFGKIVDSVVNDLIMPVVAAIVGKPDFSDVFIPLKDVPADYSGAMTYAELSKVIPVFGVGQFITIVLNFVILAWIIFLLVKFANKLRTPEPAAAPAAPPPTPEDIILLREIRDSLKK